MRISSSRKTNNTNGRSAKRAWTEQEDQKLIDYIKIHGESGCWSTVPKAAELKRCGKSCRHRWIKYLRADIRRANFGIDEEDLIIKLHALLGDRWSLIAGRLPGRTENEVKKYWNSHIKTKLQNAGIDPHNYRIDQTLILTTTNATSRVSEKEPSETLSESTNSSASIDDDDDDDAKEVEARHGSSSTQLNLDLTIAVPASASSSSRFVLAEQKKREESDHQLRADIDEGRENKDKPVLLLFR